MQGDIQKCKPTLKNNKSSGDGQNINQYIKATSHLFSDIYARLFNLIFYTESIMETWLTVNIQPIYKNKGDKLD